MRTHYCGDLNSSHIDQTVTLCGWVNTNRDHGGVIFIDLRDKTGIAQVVADPDEKQAFTVADAARNEYVLKVTGRIRQRPEGTINTELPSGHVELYATEIEVLNSSEPIPFQFDEDDVGEAVRLKYRYLDLRSEKMQRNIRLRHQIIQLIREYLNVNGFVDIETPILTRSTPEGARDYLVPSRTHPGQFFALPQSPQLFKQLLMVSGFERYYQIARCFRDEDLRADRQPEFTQLDIEMSFIEEQHIMTLVEELFAKLFQDLLGVNIELPLQQMTYAEAMRRFGSDRPDLRIPLELVDVDDLLKDVEFKVFSGPANQSGGRVAALRLPQGGKTLTRQQIDQYTEYVKQFGAKGLAYIKVNQLENGTEGLQSPILKFLPDDVIQEIMRRTNAENGDLVFFGADSATIVNDALGHLRVKLGQDLSLVNGDWQALWVIDFPLVEYDPIAKRWIALHHPFTSPKTEHLDQLEADPGKVLSRAYDLVLNGTEIGGGSIRIHDQAVQRKVFDMLDINEAEAEEKFGFLLSALKYGAPPHGGIAWGLDRLAAMMSGSDSIRDVIAFPKTQKASCLMTESPNQVSDTQLKELNIRLRKQS